MKRVVVWENQSSVTVAKNMENSQKMMNNNQN